MDPDNDTHSDLTDYDNEDEEYQAMIRDHDATDVSSYLCEAYFQAKRRWRKFTGRSTRRRRFINR
eukprot:3019555-Prorocentrum_lima.AAC.1